MEIPRKAGVKASITKDATETRLNLQLSSSAARRLGWNTQSRLITFSVLGKSSTRRLVVAPHQSRPGRCLRKARTRARRFQATLPVAKGNAPFEMRTIEAEFCGKQLFLTLPQSASRPIQHSKQLDLFSGDAAHV